jgi:hypothetical protein
VCSLLQIVTVPLSGRERDLRIGKNSLMGWTPSHCAALPAPSGVNLAQEVRRAALSFEHEALFLCLVLTDSLAAGARFMGSRRAGWTVCCAAPGAVPAQVSSSRRPVRHAEDHGQNRPALLSSNYMARQELRTLFCARFDCSLEQYEELAFCRCLPWYARLLAPLLRKLNPEFFAEDFRFIRYLGTATGGRDVNSEVLAFQDTNRAKRSFLRTGFHLRVSGRKAAGLAQSLFSEARRA